MRVRVRIIAASTSKSRSGVCSFRLHKFPTKDNDDRTLLYSVSTSCSVCFWLPTNYYTCGNISIQDRLCQMFSTALKCSCVGRLGLQLHYFLSHAFNKCTWKGYAWVRVASNLQLAYLLQIILNFFLFLVAVWSLTCGPIFLMVNVKASAQILYFFL